MESYSSNLLRQAFLRAGHLKLTVSNLCKNLTLGLCRFPQCRDYEFSSVDEEVKPLKVKAYPRPLRQWSRPEARICLIPSLGAFRSRLDFPPGSRNSHSVLLCILLSSFQNKDFEKCICKIRFLMLFSFFSHCNL